MNIKYPPLINVDAITGNVTTILGRVVINVTVKNKPGTITLEAAEARDLAAKINTALAAKSRSNPIAYYSAVEPKLFDSIIAKYTHVHAAPGAAPRR